MAGECAGRQAVITAENDGHALRIALVDGLLQRLGSGHDLGQAVQRGVGVRQVPSRRRDEVAAADDGVAEPLLRAAAETLATIAINPRHLDARIGFTSVRHTWGSAMPHHPHLHIIAAGGGLATDGSPVRVLSRLFRRLYLEGLVVLRSAGRLAFHGDVADTRSGCTTAADCLGKGIAPTALTDANPETTNQGRFLAGRPVPASWVGVSYWAIHPYTLTNAQGATQIVKFKMSPKGGEVGLNDEDAKGKPADFLVDELKARLARKKPAGFDVLAILGSAGDVAVPATQTWPDEETRRSIKLAELTVTGLAENDICDREIFDPTRLAEGVAGPTDDPLFAERAPAYAISITQRN
jgi:hypothetical protein